MSRLHVFTTRALGSIAAEQPHQKMQITSVNIKPDHRYQQPNVCVVPPAFLHFHSQPIKRKCVTDPLTEAVRASLCGNLPITDMVPTTDCSTSGSDHDIDSESLADMIYSYGIVEQHRLEGECSPNSSSTNDCEIDAEGSNTRDFKALFREQLYEILEGVSSSSSSTTFAFEMHLLLDAKKAVALAKENLGFIAAENVEQKSRSRRFVMNNLRFAGYKAAVCKSRWEKTTGHPAGDYEFIDVVIEDSKMKNDRCFVDMDFTAQFEIARPTDEYSALLQHLPTLFVGRAEKLCGVIKIMCNAARRSLKERGMYIPPWRKYRYMQFKWLGPYKRTTNPTGWRAVQAGACNGYRGFLHFPFSGIALKATGWDASVVHKIEKSNNAADTNERAKTKSTKQGIVHRESADCLSTEEEKDRPVKKISGLATALGEAGLTYLSPCSNGT